MKKLFLSFAVFSAIASCSNDNDHNEQRESIEGNWKVQKAEIFVQGTNKTTIFLPQGCEAENTLEFDGINQVAVNYELKNNVCSPKANSIQYNYDKSSRVIYYNTENGQYSYKITLLTKTDMVIENDKYGVDDNGNTKIFKRYYKKIK
ncbi:hypothetical protein C1631_021960 [Chryseobacterium phosphatilyticum]|uniref:Lipocalin-like domain-containing protein n=1 Tax=Chryseobacterium phosphatilyticum TaxID=475075 RepID=A0A316WR34_9FLAO|nr:lipocalin family protein [Chryseobacterium phosphatilyticum]PWN63639.1 hypothetical protein C1631_021960 [Chryseobacterium phosphatilyticum]